MRKTLLKFGFILPMVSIFILSLGLILYSFWYALYRIEPKQINLFNFLPYQIQVDYLNRKLLVNPFEITNLELNTAEDFNISFVNSEHNFNKKMTISELSNYKEIIYITLDQDNSHCYVDGLVNSEDRTLNFTKLISKTYMDYFVTKIKDYQNLSFIPQLKLAEFLQNRVVFPVPCGMENNLENYNEIWKTFLNYNATEQLNYYEDNLKKINSTKNIQELNSL